MTTITNHQFEALRSYLDEDARSHIKRHGKWRLDAGKLQAALEGAGIVVKGEDGGSRYAVAIYCDRDGELPARESLSLFVVRANDQKDALEVAAEFWAHGFDDGHYLDEFCHVIECQPTL
jgi:hypothetical protein